MSTHRFAPVVLMREGTRLLVFSMLSGLLITLQLLLPSIAFATTNTARSGTARILPPQQQEVLDLVGVSVLRLLVTYKASGSNPPSSLVLCTGLGTLISSGPSSITNNSWVLTDSSLVHLSGKTCLGTTGQLESISLFPNTTYTNTALIPQAIGQLQCSSSGCHDGVTDTGPAELIAPPAETAESAVLFSFHSDAQHPQPFLNVAQPGAPTSAQSFGIELTQGSAGVGQWPQSPVVVQTAEPTQFLFPTLIANTSAGAGNVPTVTTTNAPSPAPPAPSTTVYEPGMPLLDANGTLTGMYLSGNKQITFPQIDALMATQLELQPAALNQARSTNPLYKNWMTGVTDYYHHDYKGADTALKAIEHTNPQFQAPLAYDTQKVGPALQSSQKNVAPTSASGNGNGTILGFPAQLVIMVGLIAGLVVLIFLLVVVSLTFGRARARRRREMAQFKAEQAEAQRMAELEAQRQQPSKITARLQSPFSVVRCPNCNKQVTANDAVCPNCHYLLSASDSGMHLRALPPSTEAPTQPNLVQSVPGSLPAPAISEMPTIQFSPSNGTNDNEKTLPYNIQQLQGRNLSLAVGARTDRGIKRQHKPNEDNLFAIQATRPNDAQPQEFGLFVVADGMGGHANGQDASRLAIQTIIDFMLPRLSSGTPMSEDDFKNLLTEGVQRANQAVHQRNMEERADMGTTMTASLIVGAIAYVANVGDSRTYLYREPEGLVKITHDHSVVASLVDAGIIKPDDIYTHPKRNQIYRSLGEKPYVEVDTFKVPLQVGDKLLLCSDGLWDMVRDPDIQRVMSTPMPDPSKTGKALIQAALDGGGEDNVTVIVVSINEMSNQPTISGVQLFAKPETVNVPDMQQK